MPYLTARTEEVQGPLFLRKFGVPLWALARVFGATHMAWYRRECALGRFSIVGTTVRQAELPAHLLADEHHQSRDGQKLYIATTVGHWYLHSKNRFTGNYLGPICRVGLRKAPGGVLSAGPGKQRIGDGDDLGSTGTTDTDAGRHHCGETHPPKELRRKSLRRYQ